MAARIKVSVDLSCFLADIKFSQLFFSISSISVRNSFCQANQSTKILVMRQIVVVKINCCLFSDRSNSRLDKQTEKHLFANHDFFTYH